MPPYERPVNMMFQSYALFPHMSVEQNVGYGLDQRADVRRPAPRPGPRDARPRQLAGLGGRKPHQISGGQRQRVALARALAKAPKLLLLDEPLAALDKKLREHTQFELAGIQYRTGVTFVVVTHDQEEAMTLANRIAVMDRGRIRQVGTPTEIYEFPRTRFVADFIGSINMFDGPRRRESTARLAAVDLPELGAVDARPIPGLAAGQADHPRASGPRRSRSAATAPGGRNAVEGVVEDLGYFGKDSLYRVRLASGRVLLGQLDQRPPRRRDRAGRPVGGRVWLAFDPRRRSC